MLSQFDILVCLPNQISDQIFDIPAHITGLAKFGSIALNKRHTDFIGNQLDDVGFAHTGRSDHQDIVFYIADHCGFSDIILCFLCALDAIEVRANFGGQDRFGAVLFDNKLIQVGDKFFRLEIKIDLFFALARLDFINGVLLWQNHRRYHFDIVTKFFR